MCRNWYFYTYFIFRGMKMDYAELGRMQKFPLDEKVLISQMKIIEYYNTLNGKIYVSFSGGKDSTVLLHLVRQLYPDTPAVFIDTGLEYPEIKEFVSTVENVTIIKPKMSFPDVIKKYGYPVISKEQSNYIYEARTTKSEKLREKRLNGVKMKSSGRYKGKIAEKYKYLLDAPFKISDRCCFVMKKNPAKKYEKDTELHPIVGNMAEESSRRIHQYLKYGCNALDATRKISRPLGFWTEQDILLYIKTYNLPYCSIYGDIIEQNGGLITTGENRTGCMFCMFGQHLQTGENKFQRMKRTHPKIYDYCLNNLGLKSVLEYIKVPYE